MSDGALLYCSFYLFSPAFFSIIVGLWKPALLYFTMSPSFVILILMKFVLQVYGFAGLDKSQYVIKSLDEYNDLGPML